MSRADMVASRPPAFVLLFLGYGLNGERIVRYMRDELELKGIGHETRGPMQLGGYASSEDPVLVDIVRRFEAGEPLPITRRAQA